MKTVSLMAGRRIAGIFAAALACGAILAPASAAGRHHLRPAPPDSFLAYKVYSLDGLLAEVRSSPRIQRVYARHFHVPQSRVIEYMRANLVESYVPETRVYTCYCVRPNGLIYPVKQRFERGTKVFALRNGEPVLKWVCGNPLSRFLPAVETRTVVHEVPVVKIAPDTEVIAPTDNVEVIVPTETPGPISFSTTDTETKVATLNTPAPESSQFMETASSSGSSFPWPLLAVPLLFIHLDSDSTPSQPVPEASSVESFGIMLAAGCLLYGRSRRSRAGAIVPKPE